MMSVIGPDRSRRMKMIGEIGMIRDFSNYEQSIVNLDSGHV